MALKIELFAMVLKGKYKNLINKTKKKKKKKKYALVHF
jgi:hypothetical protein